MSGLFESNLSAWAAPQPVLPEADAGARGGGMTGWVHGGHLFHGAHYQGGGQ